MKPLRITLTEEKRTNGEIGCKNCGILNRELYLVDLTVFGEHRSVSSMCSWCVRHRIFSSVCWSELDRKVPVVQSTLPEG